MNKPVNPRRPARTPSTRPRRVAGLSRPATVAPAVEQEGPLEEVDAPARVELTKPASEAAAVTEAVVEPEVPDEEPDQEPDQAPESVPAPRRRGVLTGVLVVVIVLLLGVLVGELLYLRGGDETRISASRPVLAPDLTVRRVVEQAAQEFDVIATVDPETYDADVETAAALMTTPFADEYRVTKADVKDAVVDGQITTVIDISTYGVVTATEQQVVALVFFTQTTQKGARGGAVPVPFRAEVTMTNTSDGWLVSGIRTL